MDNQDQRKTQATGHENHGVHLCHKCGWPFPNPHPSAKHRRAHKRICGIMEGYKLVAADDDTSHVHLSNDDHHSDENRRNTPSPRGMESSNTQKPSGGVRERLISGEEVFADAVAEFWDGGWNSGAEENVRDNLKSVTVKDESVKDLVGSAVAMVNQLKRKSGESNQMQDRETSETTGSLESNPTLHDHRSNQIVNSTVNVPDYRREESGVMLLDSTPGLSSRAYPNKVEGPVDVLHEGDNGNGMTGSTFSLEKDAAASLPLREAPVRTFEETTNLNLNNVASLDAEPARDFVPKEENNAESFIELNQNVHSSDVGPLQQVSISTNNIQVDLRWHTLQEGEGKDENACKISVSDNMSNVANPTILIEDSEDPEGVKLQISSTLQSPEAIRNDEDDLKDVASVERFIVVQSESSSMASDVPPGESYVTDDNAKQQNESDKVVVIEEPREQQITEPPIEGKINVDQSSEEIEASLLDFGPNISGQIGSLSKEQDSDDFCKVASVVNPPDCPVSVSNFNPTDVSVYSFNHDKSTSVDGSHNGVTEESDRSVGISTLQSISKEPLLQDKLTASIVDGEDNSNHENLETESHDTFEFHFRECSMESEGNLHETKQTAGLICNDNTHHFEDMKIDGVYVDESDKLEADTKRFDDETKTATLQPSGSPSRSREEQLINKTGVCKACEIENRNITEDQNLAEHLGNNTLPLDSTSSIEIGDESVKKSQGIPCPQSLTLSRSEKEKHDDDDTDIIGMVPVECESYTNTAVDLQTDIVTRDEEMEDPISKDKQTEDLGGEAAGLLSASTYDQDANDLVKQQSIVSGIDFSVGFCSRSDSLECNWGSVSVLSLQSDAPAAYDFQQSEKSEMYEPGDVGKKYAAVYASQIGQNPQHPSSTPLHAGWFPFPSLPHVTNDSEGRNKKEEVIAKVTNWSTGKQHAQLKSLLSEAAQSPTPQESLGLENQKSQETEKDNGAKTMRTVHSILGLESPAAQFAKKEIAKEWNSPARYPSDIQIEKRKVKGRPFWTQFVCCTSVNSQ